MTSLSAKIMELGGSDTDESEQSGELGRGVADRRADPRIIAGLERADAALHRPAHRLAERLDGFEPYP